MFSKQKCTVFSLLVAKMLLDKCIFVKVLTSEHVCLEDSTAVAKLSIVVVHCHTNSSLHSFGASLLQCSHFYFYTQYANFKI